MMKYIKILFAGLFIFTICSAFSWKGISLKRFTLGKTREPVYAFGIAASFLDSVVYYTSVQVLDSVSLDKEGHLPQREMYSYQLRNYVESDLGKAKYTCMIYFNTNQQKLEKNFLKIKSRYEKENDLILQEINPDAFLFKKPADEE